MLLISRDLSAHKQYRNLFAFTKYPATSRSLPYHPLPSLLTLSPTSLLLYSSSDAQQLPPIDKLSLCCYNTEAAFSLRFWPQRLSAKMASNFMRKPGLQTSPLQDLAAYFQKVRTQEGIVSYAPLWLHTSTTDEITVSLPNPILNTIKQSRDHGSEHSEREVDAVVGALESSTPQLCMRLDTRGLLVLCSVLVHAQACLAQHRGLYLLKVSCLTSRNSITHTKQEALLASPDDGVQKAAVGSEALLPLIKGFLKSDNTDETRRWVSPSPAIEVLPLIHMTRWASWLLSS